MSPRPYARSCARLRVITAVSLLVVASVVSFSLGVEVRHMARELFSLQRPQQPDPITSQHATGAIGAPIPPPLPRPRQRRAVVKSAPRPPTVAYVASGARRARPQTARTRPSATSTAARRCQRQGGQWHQIIQTMSLPEGTQRLTMSFCVGAAVADDPPVPPPPVVMAPPVVASQPPMPSAPPRPPDLFSSSARMPPPPVLPPPLVLPVDAPWAPDGPPPWAGMPGGVDAFAPPMPPPSLLPPSSLPMPASGMPMP